MNKNKRLIYISLLAAQGVVITMLERALPFPLWMTPDAPVPFNNSASTKSPFATVVRRRVAQLSTSTMFAAPPKP